MASCNIDLLENEFLEEYSTRDSIRRYTRTTAGYGISYLLDHNYGDIYREVLQRYVPKGRLQSGIRLLEFGCGGGMNLIHLLSLLERQGIPLQLACGTDFSGALLAAAGAETKSYLAPALREKVRFIEARNETLMADLAAGMNLGPQELAGSFDLLVGVNTIRYCHRLKNQAECVKGIFSLLAPGGTCVVIDMNDKFPAFRSRFRDQRTKEKEALYLPSLEAYAAPFHAAGFEVLRQEHFCWVPHSAGRGLTTTMRILTPFLNVLTPQRAMRSLVVARKPLTASA